MTASIHVRPLEPRDRDAWLALWDGYCSFYGVVIPADVTESTWARLLNPDQPMFGLVAAIDDPEKGERVIGIANCVVHLNTWTDRPICYLEDLFVAPGYRGRGAARHLIEALAAKARAERWTRIYWMTHGDNDTARALYDKMAKLSDFVRYDLYTS